MVALVAAVFFSRKAVADRLQYMCDRGFRYVQNLLACQKSQQSVPYNIVKSVGYSTVAISEVPDDCTAMAHRVEVLWNCLGL